MKRVTILTVAALVLAAAASALGSGAKHCGVVSYSWVRQGDRHSGQDSVFVLRGGTSCATARRVDSRADEGLRTPGWRCAFSQHATVTTCTSAQRAEIQGIPYVPPPSAPTPTPVSSPTPIPTTPAPAPAPAPTPTGCYPLTNSGGCYEPGEYCRDSDHGITGVAGDGEAIMCEDNNGWRWEPT
jgi:hypothetical protein